MGFWNKAKKWGNEIKEGVKSGDPIRFSQAMVDPFSRKVGETIDKNFFSGDWDKKREQNEEKARTDKIVESEIDKSLKQQKAVQDAYRPVRNAKFDELDKIDDGYLNSTKSLRTESEQSGKNASTVYSNMSNKYGAMQDTADNESNSAMSLKDYMNPNNAVSAGTRDLYNSEGANQQKIYETQAGNEDRQGQASYGILASLGAQATAGQMGGMGPLSVGQQVAMQAQNQRQAGDAYANVQRRMQGLRDQGLQANVGNRNRGMDAGFERSDRAYAAGQGARDRSEGLMRDRRGMEGEFRAFEQNNRNERTNFDGNLRNVDSGKANRRLAGADEDRSTEMQQESNRIAEQMRRAGVSEARINAQMQADAASLAGRQAIAGAALKTAGTVAGGMVGGPAGAMAGGAIAGGVTDAAMAQNQQPAPSQVNLSNWQPNQANLAPAQQSVTNWQPNQPDGFGNFLTKKYGQKPQMMNG